MKYLQLPLLFTILILAGSVSAQKVEAKEKKGKWGLFEGKNKIVDYQYSEMEKKGGGFYSVKLDGKWGLIDSKGAERISCQYDTLISSWNQRYIVSEQGVYGAIDTAGIVRVPVEYEEIDYSMDTIALVKKEGKWGYLQNGEIDFNPERLVFYTPEKMAMFKGCELQETDDKELKQCADREMLMYIYKNIKYPPLARENGVEGTVVIEFLVSPEGKIVEPRIRREIGGGCGMESLRVIKSMPMWNPAIQDGDFVWNKFFLPVKFRLH